MSRRLLRPGYWTLMLAPFWAASASASSITCYGSIVLSTLGTEGMAVTVPDVSVAQPAGAGSAAAATIGDPGSATIKALAPLMGSNAASPSPAAPTSSRGGPSAPTAGQGVPNSSTTTATPVVSPPRSDGTVPVVVTPDTPKPEIPVENVPPPPLETMVPSVTDATTAVPVSTDVPVVVSPPAAPQDLAVTTGPPISDTADSPEPASLTLLGLAGLGGLLRLRRRK